jgi:hypothetical protein
MKLLSGTELKKFEMALDSAKSTDTYGGRK